jgi:hypothetical protein
MATLLARCLTLGLAATLAASVPVLAQSSPDDQYRSESAQSDNQATTDTQQNSGQQASQYDQQQQNQNWQQNQDPNAQARQDGQDQERGFFGRRDDEQSRRETRQDQRQDRRDDRTRLGSRDRQPAIGVTVVERGGMGVRVMAVVPNSPAAQAGIRPGDTILEVEGRSVGTAQQLVTLIQQQEAGDTAEFAVIREGREYQVPVRLATREQALPPRLRRQDGSQDQQGQQFGQTSPSWQQSGQDQSWQQGQSWQQDPNRWQQGQYDQSQQYGQQQYDRSQYGQQQGQRQQFDQQGQYRQGQSNFGPPQPPSPYTGAYTQDQGTTQQAYYGGQGADNSRQSQYTQDTQRQPIGDRLARRLDQFEQRLQRIAQRLDQIERDGVRFQAGQTQTSPSQQTTPPSDDEEQNENDQGQQ